MDSLCELAQIAPSSSGPSPCADEAAPGWCYSNEICVPTAGENCEHALCKTTAFTNEQVSFVYEVFYCP